MKAAKKIPGCYILINHKYESGYIKAFVAFKRILSIEYSKSVNIKSITTDFEDEIMNAINYIFPNVKIIGCPFHFVRAIR